MTVEPIAESDALPDHMDWDGPCDHRAAWDAVITHTRTVNGVGPDHCEECSDAIREWVPWPCPRATPPREVWDDSAAPGGYVCSLCGWPTESEPCEHLTTCVLPPAEGRR